MEQSVSMAGKFLGEPTSIQLSQLITKVRRAKTAAEERSIIKKESAYIRTALSHDNDKYAKRNMIKLMYIRMLGYPSEYGQVPCLALITKGDYTAKRVGYLALMLLLDEKHETLMMVTNSMRNDLHSYSDHWVLINALNALANIASKGMALDLSSEVAQLTDTRFLSGKGISGVVAAHVRKKALLAACRMVTRAPELIDTFKDLPGIAIQDGNHAVVMASVTLMMTIIAVDETDGARKHYVTATVPGTRQQTYTQLLTVVLSKLHHSRNNFEYMVNGICNPFLQVKVLRCLAILGRDSQDATDSMTDMLAKVAAAHANVPARTGRQPRTTSAAVGTQAASTIMSIKPVPMLRTYAVQIMANCLKLFDNNMRYVALNTLLHSATTDLTAVQRHRSMIVECVKDADTTIRRRALDLVYALVDENNVKALTKELLSYLAVTDEDFKGSLTQSICLLVQKYAPDTKWFIDTLLQVLVMAGKYVQDTVARAFVVRVGNCDDTMKTYAAQQCLQHATEHLHTADPAMLCPCVWVLGEYGELLNTCSWPDENGWEPVNGATAALLLILTELAKPMRSAEEHAYVVMAATKLMGRLPTDSHSVLQSLVRSVRTDRDVEVQQRSCEVTNILDNNSTIPEALTEAIPPLDEATYAGNLREEVDQLQGSGKEASNLLDDLLIGAQDSTDGAAATGGTQQASSLLDDLEHLFSATAAPSAAAPVANPASTPAAVSTLPAMPVPAPPHPAAPSPDPGVAALAAATGPASVAPAPAAVPQLPADEQPYPPFDAWTSSTDGIVIQFACSAGDGGKTTIMASYTNHGAAAVTSWQVLAAVPKRMSVQMMPQVGGSDLHPFGANTVTQLIQCVNSLRGTKALMMRLKVLYSVAGTTREHIAVVDKFPVGL